MSPFNFKSLVHPAPTVGSPAPPKYTKVNGVTKLNPDWKKWKEVQNANGQPATTTLSPKKALPVVTNLEDHKLLCEASVAKGGQEIPLAEATIATMEIMQEPEIAMEAGMQADQVLDQLGQVLNKYEVPMGLMNKLMVLSEYDYLEFMIDDSGSMNAVSDTLDARTRKPQSRWQEAQTRLKSMLEILAYVPFQEIQVCFLNRSQRLSLVRHGRSPQEFLNDACRQVDQVFLQSPAGTTPVLDRIYESLARGDGRNVSRYLFCE